MVTLPETNIEPENGWLEYYFPVGSLPIFRGKLAVSFREGNNPLDSHNLTPFPHRQEAHLSEPVKC